VNWAPVVAAIIAGLVAVGGYAVTQFANRRDTKARTYAEAIAAVTEYQELPYLVMRRAASDAPTRAAFAQHQSEVMAKLGFYRAWVRIDSAETGAVYANLVSDTRRQCRRHLATAWAEDLLKSDTQMSSPEAPFPWDIEAERDLCLKAMRRELRPWGFLQRRSTQRQFQNLQRTTEAAKRT
jgi:hypothetical protein